MASAFAAFPMLRLLLLLIAALFLVPPPLFTTNSTPSLLAEASIFQDFAEAVNDASCPEQHEVSLKVCQVLAFPFYGLQPAFTSNDRQELACCARLAAFNCFSLVNKVYCGQVGQALGSFAAFLARIASSSDFECSHYDSVTDCTHPVLLLFLVVFFIALFIAILKSIYACCCRGRCGRGRANRPGQVLYYRPQNPPVLA